MNNHIHLLNHFGNLIRKYPEHHYWISQIGTLAIKYPEKIDQIADCFSFGQIESKLWLIKELLNVTDDELSMECFGLNHLSWFRKFKINGKDITKNLIKLAAAMV